MIANRRATPVRRIVGTSPVQPTIREGVAKECQPSRCATSIVQCRLRMVRRRSLQNRGLRARAWVKGAKEVWKGEERAALGSENFSVPNLVFVPEVRLLGAPWGGVKVEGRINVAGWMIDPSSTREATPEPPTASGECRLRATWDGNKMVVCDGECMSFRLCSLSEEAPAAAQGPRFSHRPPATLSRCCTSSGG